MVRLAFLSFLFLIFLSGNAPADEGKDKVSVAQDPASSVRPEEADDISKSGPSSEVSEAVDGSKGPAGWQRRLQQRRRQGAITMDNLSNVPSSLEEDYFELFGGALYAGFTGFLQVDFLQDVGDPGNKFSFAPSQLPITTITDVDNSGFISLGDSARLSFRNTRLGFSLYTPYPGLWGGTRAILEADLSGVGGAPNLRHAFISLPYLLIGRTDSVFRDADSEPETVDGAGPNALIGTRQNGIRVIAPMGDWSVALSAEDSGGIITPTGVVLSDDKLSQRADFGLHIRGNQDWGHVQISGILRDLEEDGFQSRTGRFPGWGVALNGRAYLGESNNSFQFGLAGGDGIGRMLGDLQGTNSELGLNSQGQLGTQFAYGTYLAYQHYWSETTRSTIYASHVAVNLRDGQPADSYRYGTKAAVNYFESVSDDLTWGVEAMWGRRSNLNGDSASAGRVQALLRYGF
jgi:DcaP outer membrane protein